MSKTAKAIPERKDVDPKYTWDLTPIFPDDAAWEAAYADLQKVVSEIAEFRGKLGSSAGKLLEYFRKDDEISLKAEAIYGYASLSGDQDTGNGFYQNMRGKAMGVIVALQGAAAFSVPEILAIDDETMERFYKEEPGLLEYKRPIDKIRRRKAHCLSAGEEQLLASAGEMADSPDNIAGILRNADMTYPDAVDGEGARHTLTGGLLTLLLESSDRVLRKNAFETYYNRLGEFKNTIAATLDGQFKQLRFFTGARKYGNTLEAALDHTEVPVEVYTNLIQAVHDNLDKMYRYVDLRKRLLNVDELHMYDVYTPVVADVDAEIPFEAAKSTVLDALKVLGEDYTSVLKTAFKDRWIDVYENKGKRSGAYSSGLPRPHPYVLLNHKDNLDSQFTLAHELGHAMHSYLSTKNQPVCTADYVIFVAEVASTVNEVLLMRYLLSRTTEPKERAYLINHFLDQFKGTVYRQTMFAEFELFMGQKSEAGETLTADLLCDKYYELNKLYFGPSMLSDELIGLEWARIPHFFYNYYVFQYATGFSAAVAIANRILSEGEAAVRDYKKFLSSGGSADPISLLKIAGVDMSTPDPVNSALKLFGDLVEEMEKLTSVS